MNQDQNLNFNVAENQDRCIYRDYVKQTKPYHYANMIIQYFMYRRNYGWTTYKGVLYNLNKAEQAQAFLGLLESEGFLKIEGTDYTVLDSDYIGFTKIPRFKLLFELYHLKGTPLSKSECIRRDNLVLKSRLNKP